MATREQIFGILAAASAPMSRHTLEEKVGESYRHFQTQLNRWEKAEYIEDKGDHNYVLTERGRKVALTGMDVPPELQPGNELPGEGEGETEDGKAENGAEKPGSSRVKTQAELGTTEFQQFLKLGQSVGVTPNNLIEVITNHIWNGGDYEDLRWVAVGFQQMGLQKDLGNRWLHAWGSHLKKPMPLNLPADYYMSEAQKDGVKSDEEKGQGAGKRDYILDDDDKPQWVGDRNGTLDYKDALDLAKMRAVRKSVGASSNAPVSQAEELTKLLKLVKEFMGTPSEPKSFIVKPGENGYQVEEVEQGKPILVPAIGAKEAVKSFYVDNEGKTQEINPGQPIVIFRDQQRSQQAQTHFLVDQRSGTVTEVAPGTPIIIKTESPPVNQSVPIQMKDKDGNPMVMDITTFITLEDHRDKQRREDESHKVKMEIAQGFKGLLKHVESAVSHMGSED